MPARGVKVAMLAAGGSYIELIQAVDPSSPFALAIEERGEGLHHLALWSTDIDGDVGKLRDLGVPLEDKEPREGFPGRLSYLHRSAFEGAQVELIEPEVALAGENETPGRITRIDHAVLRVPGVSAVTENMEAWFGVATKRTFERGAQQFAFMRPGDVVIEVIGPKEGGEPGTGRIAGLAFEVQGIDELTAKVKSAGYPIGEPHPALQGGRIVSVHHSGSCGVPLAFIDFTGSPGPPGK